MTQCCAYELGVKALLADDPATAARAFALAVELEPGFHRGHAALAAALAELGAHDEATVALARAGAGQRLRRKDRHHIAVVTLALSGETARATALGCEHLDEFPDDAVVHHVLARWAGT